MPGLLLTIFLLSLLSAVSSTSEYPKSLEGWYPSSQRVRDRRGSHWDLRSHSNLYGDDRQQRLVDEERESGEISYPFLVDERSSLGFPGASSMEYSKKASNAIDFQEEEDTIDSDFNRCLTVVRKPIFFVTINGIRQQLEDANNFLVNSGSSRRFGAIRCHPKPQGWIIQEPVYVEEPRYVAIDINRQSRASSALHEDDPFYVARGKRSSPYSADYRQARTKKDLTETNQQLTDKKDKNQQTVSRRRKRDTLSDILGSSVVGGQRLAGIEGLSVDGVKAQSYVGPRNKHADLLDILNEPFFISRGKKDSTNSGNTDWYKKYVKRRFQDYLLIGNGNLEAPVEANCDPRFKDCLLESLIAKNRHIDPRWIVDDPLALRDRRGLMEDLLKEADPFYLARG